MERRRVQLEPGYLLHRRAYGDTSAILEVFSREHGRIGLIAKGVRGGRSRRAGMLQPFSELLLSWVSRGELGTLTEVEPARTPLDLAGARLVSGFYLNELLMRLLRRDDPHPALYDAYRVAVTGLARGEPEARVLRLFEKRLLEQTGYGLLLDQDTSGRAISAQASYRYRLDEGPELARPDEPGLVLPGAALLALASESEDMALHGRALRALTRAALAPHLGSKPLRSRELYRQFRGAAEGEQ